jgi:hypothetical protein
VRYKVYILRTVIYRASIYAETREDAEKKLAHDPEGEQLRLFDSWWDFDSIEAEEELYPEEEASWIEPDA